MALFAKKTVEVINVDGMKCEHCAAKVVNALKEIKVKAEVNLADKKVKVAFDDTKVSLDQIKEEINKLGFKA